MKIITLPPLVILVEDFCVSASEIRLTWDPSPCDGPLNRGQRKEVSRLRVKISCHLSHELGIPTAEIVRRVRVCGSLVH